MVPTERDGFSTPHEFQPVGDIPHFGYATAVREVQDFIASVHNHQESVVTIDGLPGIGKSGLLQMIVDKEQRESHGATLLSAKNYLTEQGFFLSLPFWKDVFTHYGYSIPGDELLAMERSDTTKLLEELIGRTPRPDLLLIDDYFSIPSQPRRILNDLIYGTITNIPTRPVIILCDEQEITVNPRLDFSKKSWRLSVGGLTSDDLATSLPEKYHQTIPWLLEYSGGMPQIVGYFLRRMHQEPQRNWNDSTEFQLLLDSTYREHLQEATLPENKPPKEANHFYRQCFESLSLLNDFNVGILQKLLPRIYGGQLPFASQKDYLTMLRFLGRRIPWSESKHGYEVDRRLQTVYRQMLSRLDEPFVWKVHESMIEVLGDIIQAKKGSTDQQERDLQYHREELRKLNHTA